MNGLVLADPVSPKSLSRHDGYEAIRSKVEDAHPESDVPSGQRVFVSGPSDAKKAISSDGKTHFERIDSTAILRHSPGMTAATLLQQMGLPAPEYAVDVYRSDSIQKFVHPGYEIKPLDTIKVVHASSRDGYASIRSKIEHANPKSDVPSEQRVFVSGSWLAKKTVGSDGTIHVKSIESTAILRHSPDMTATTLLQQLGLPATEYSLHVYRSNSIQHLVHSQYAIQPLDTIKVVSCPRLPRSRNEQAGDFDTAHERALRSGGSLKPAPTGEIGLSFP